MNAAGSLCNIKPSDSEFSDHLAKAKQSHFTIWDRAFFELIGPKGKVEKIQSFGKDEQHVHEAPAYIPETRELLFSDTSIVGWLWAVNIDTHEVTLFQVIKQLALIWPSQTRKLHTDPPLHNVNGATYHDGFVYLVTNGGSVRGLHRLNVTTGKAETILNNYRGRRFNSPNDLIFDSSGNILFTDPTYGWHTPWPGVEAPELPNAVYHFNPATGAVITLSNSVVAMPNGLALSKDESILYVADSASTPPSGGDLSTQRNVWAFDYKGTVLSNPRVIYQADSGWPDGIRVTSSGYLMVAVAGGVDVIDPSSGLYLGKINTPDDIIFNLEAAAGKGGGIWLLTGMKHVYKVTMSEGPKESLAAKASQLGDNIIDAVKSFVGAGKEEL